MIIGVEVINAITYNPKFITMKKLAHTLTALFLGICFLANATDRDEILRTFTTGDPDIQSMNALSFAEHGILLIGDSKSAKVFAVDIADNKMGTPTENIEMSKVDEVIAATLGTTADQISIQDMAINPVSKAVYLAVQNSDGMPVLLKLRDNAFESVNLKRVKYAEVSINDPVAMDAEDGRGRPQRVWAISDLGYSNGKVYVSGLSNKEFGSTFRSIPFPFTAPQKQSSLEIYHASHGRFETESPIKAFTTSTVNGKSSLIASYTCTPLVLLPLDMMKDGEHVKARTVAELGNWNTPLDMIVMEKDGQSYLIMANSNRAVMKIDFKDIESFNGTLTEEVKERGGTAGVKFINLPYVNVLQLDKLDDSQFLMLKRNADGDLNFVTANNRWL